MAARLVRTTSRLPVIGKSLLAIKLQRSGFCEGRGTSNGDSPDFIAWSLISSSLHDALNQFAADNDKDGFISYLQDFGPSDMNASQHT